MNLRSRRVIATTIALALGSACAFSPLAHRIKIGEEGFVVFVGEGIDHHTDLFAVPATGGEVAQVTFTSLVERGPRLSPTGEVVAFLRMRDTLPGTPRDVVMMNLLGGGDVEVPMPPDAGIARAVAWSDDAARLYIRTDRGLWQTSVPPAKVAVIPAIDSAVADSALTLWLGLPRFTRVVPCTAGGLCVIGPAGDTGQLAPHGRDAMRWGNDSVGWFQDDGISVRSLGPGHDRLVKWHDGPANPRDGSFAPASALPQQP